MDGELQRKAGFSLRTHEILPASRWESGSKRDPFDYAQGNSINCGFRIRDCGFAALSFFSGLSPDPTMESKKNDGSPWRPNVLTSSPGRPYH